MGNGEWGMGTRDWRALRLVNQPRICRKSRAFICATPCRICSYEPMRARLLGGGGKGALAKDFRASLPEETSGKR